MRGRHIGKWAAILLEPAAFIVYALLAVVFSDLCRDRNLASIYKQQQDCSYFSYFNPLEIFRWGFRPHCSPLNRKGLPRP